MTTTLLLAYSGGYIATLMLFMAQGIPLEAAERHPETAQMMIMNPLSGGGLRGLFSTHPATEERIARLRAMGGWG